MKRILSILIPVVVLGALIWWRLDQKRTADAALAQQRAAKASAVPQVAVAIAERRDIETTFEATGTLEAPRNVKISPKVSGRINFLEVHEGDAVRRGQVLVRIDDSQVEAEVRQQVANLSEAQSRLAQALIAQGPTDVGVKTQVRQQEASVASAAADYEQARRNLEYQIGAAQASVADTQGRVDNTAAAVSAASSDVASAQATLANARAKHARLANLLAKGYVAAQDVDDAATAVGVHEAALESARSKLNSAQAAHESALAQRKAAEQQVEITRNKGGADVEAARQKLAQAKASLDYARANTAQSPAYRQGVAALRASVSAAQAAVNSAQARRADTVLSCPMDGVVTGRHQDPGAMASPGQAILTIQSFKQVWVSVAVPDDVSNRVQLGQAVQVTFDAFPGQVFTASVVQMNPSADPDARQFTIRAALDNASGAFRPGMFAHVVIVTERAEQVVAIPREAVQRDGGGEYVTVVDPDEKVRRQPVTTGLSDARYVSITEGLEAGQQVVAMSSVPLKDGKQVKPVVPGAKAKGQKGRGGPPGQEGAKGDGGLPGDAGQKGMGEGPRSSESQGPATPPKGARPPS
jgi:HlyD family secretion protein